MITSNDFEKTLPDLLDLVKINGIDGEVDIYRDSYGIPHVKAGSVHDAFVGQGFATAQDRIWHMHCDRMLAYGRLAEYLGEAAVEQDVRMRCFQLENSVRHDYENLNSETRYMIQAYAHGVNSFIDSGNMPIEFKLIDDAPHKWEPWDCLAVFKGRHILMGVFEAKLWRARLLNNLGARRSAQLLPGHDGDMMIVPPVTEYSGTDIKSFEGMSGLEQAVGNMRDVDSGSNNWAVSGSRTLSGKPLMAGDPHRGLDAPNVYYQNHIACPEFDAIGLSFPGFPAFPHFGHNENVAWSVTHAVADYQDLYIERFKSDGSLEYQYCDRWEKADTRKEIHKIRNSKDLDNNVVITRHGPVIAGNPQSGYCVSLRYTSTDETNPTANCLLPMLRSRNVQDMDEAMRDWVDPSNNFVSIDIHGDIHYLNRGKLPIRSMSNAWLPVPGWTDEYEWKGFVPFDELVRLDNPANGYIATANNKISGEDYPHYISLYFGSDSRVRRIINHLDPLIDATVDTMEEIHRDIISIPGRTYAQIISCLESDDPVTKQAIELFRDWDGSMNKDLVTPTIYSVFRRKLDRLVLEPMLGSLADEAFGAAGRGAPRQIGHMSSRLARDAGSRNTSILPEGLDWQTLAQQALKGAIEYLKSLLGNDIDLWRWGTVHRTEPKHKLSSLFPDLSDSLDPPSVPMSGDGDTVHSSSFGSGLSSINVGESFTVTGTSVARYVFDAGDWDKSRWVVPLGSSGNPASEHYADQTSIWSDDQLIPMSYDWFGIESNAETKQKLQS